MKDKSACLEFILIQFLIYIFFTFHRHSVRPDVWRGEGWSSWDWPPRWFPDEPRQEQIPWTTGSCVGQIPWCSWAWGPAAALPWLVLREYCAKQKGACFYRLLGEKTILAVVSRTCYCMATPPRANPPPPHLFPVWFNK